MRWRSNVWLVPNRENDEDNVSAAALHRYLAQVRSEFEYAILEGPPAAGSNEATAMAQFADGVVLVLSARDCQPDQEDVGEIASEAAWNRADRSGVSTSREALPAALSVGVVRRDEVKRS